MPIEGALTSKSSMKCHVTMDPGDGIVSLEQQEQECRTNALVDINVIPFFQAGRITIILQWKVKKFPEGSTFPSYPRAVADSYWTFQWSNMGPITFDVLLHHLNVQDTTHVQNKCIEKILLLEDLTLVKNCCMVLLYILWCLTRISGPNKNCDCTRVKLRHFSVFIWYRQLAAERHWPFIIMNFKTFRNGKQPIKFFILHLTALWMKGRIPWHQSSNSQFVKILLHQSVHERHVRCRSQEASDDLRLSIILFFSIYLSCHCNLDCLWGMVHNRMIIVIILWSISIVIDLWSDARGHLL